MAKITTATNETVYQIKTWLGVNEAPEGDSRLKVGEAAAMRNFKITAGGALKKRAGSLNVAGLMTEYIAYVDEESEKTLITMYGTPTALTMHPRCITDSVGIPTVDGTGFEVTAATAADHIHSYYESDGKAYRFLRLDTNIASGDFEITGGAATKGALTKIATGKNTNQSGSVVITGTESIMTYAELSIDENGNTVIDGETAEHASAFGSTEGWVTQDVGGYLAVNEKPYLYYGSKTESYSAKHKWKKHKCTRSTNSYSYYTQSGWAVAGTYTAVEGDVTSGSASYYFNSSTGTFTPTGNSVSIGYGISGTIYYGGGSSIHRATSNGSVVTFYSNSANGPYWSSYYTYSVGDYIEDVLVTDGQYPDIDTLSYVTTTTSGSLSYTVMTDGTNFYAYTKNTEDTQDYYICEYAWYAYPLTVEATSYSWVFNNMLSRSNDADSIVRGIWSGYVNGSEVLCAACNGFLWELNLTDGKWSKTACGALNTASDVHMFGFAEKLYLLNGSEYLVWDGETLSEVTGYRPLISTSVPPGGGGTSLESVNKLNGTRRSQFSPDGESVTFTLPEKNIESVDYVRYTATDEDVDGWTADTETGTVTFETAPANGINTIEIGWSVGTNDAAKVRGMRYSELYNGTQDTRVFLYGDGTNAAIYSGLDENGQARADYFPDLNVAAVGDENTPITAMIRHYNKLMAFKLDSAYSIYYDTLTLASGEVTSAFYITPVNRSIGNCALGQVELVENRPRTLDGRSVIEWKATSTSGTVTGDQRNAQRVSQRVDRSIRDFDLSTARTFYDKYAHEYYVIGADGTALVNNVDADAWYIYTNFDARVLINYKDELYFGTEDGYLRHFSDSYFSDNDEAIDAFWESGSMAFDSDYMRKYSAMLWVGIKPENNGYLQITAETDRKSDFAEYSFSTDDASEVPTMNRIKLKAKKFTFYKLILSNNTSDTTATVVSADIRVRGTGYVR